MGSPESSAVKANANFKLVRRACLAMLVSSLTGRGRKPHNRTWILPVKGKTSPVETGGPAIGSYPEKSSQFPLLLS